MAPNLLIGLAAVCAASVSAGTIASSSGSAIVVPSPRSTVRRDSAFFVMNMTGSFWSLVALGLRSSGP